MALAIASTQQHVYRRNYDESKWQPVGTDTNGCRVQVAKNSGEFYFKISFKDPVDNTVVVSKICVGGCGIIDTSHSTVFLFVSSCTN